MFLVTVTVISFWNKKTKRIYKHYREDKVKPLDTFSLLKVVLILAIF